MVAMWNQAKGISYITGLSMCIFMFDHHAEMKTVYYVQKNRNNLRILMIASIVRTASRPALLVVVRYVIYENMFTHK